MLVLQIAFGIVLGVVLLALLPILIEFAGSIVSDMLRPVPTLPPPPPREPVLPISRGMKWFLLGILLLSIIGLPIGYFGQDGAGRADPEFGMAIALWSAFIALAVTVGVALKNHDRSTRRAVEKWEAEVGRATELRERSRALSSDR